MGREKSRNREVTTLGDVQHANAMRLKVRVSIAARFKEILMDPIISLNCEVVELSLQDWIDEWVKVL